jgi:outer membrane PBP1 activator LpoA protein
MPRAAAEIALLLPLSGRLEEAGEALRDGFMAAYYRLDESARPPVRVYDVGSDPAAAYRRAVDEGAGFIVGPLGKENVQAVRAVADGRVGVLALNVLPDGDAVPRRFYQFALAPEDEARQVAERLLADERRTGVALVPSGEWGARIIAAFQATFTAGGGHLVTVQTYASGTTDFSDTLVPLLGFEDSQRRYRAVAALVGGGLQFNPRRRDDLEFVFFAGQPVHGRLVRQQLKFYYAGDLPVYSVSDVFEPNPAANQDLEGVAFVDMPWMTSDSSAIADLRASVGALWPASARRRGRLFAMGHDALLLVGALRRGPLPFVEPVVGLTGRLTLDATGRVRRLVDWSAIGADGLPHPLQAGPVAVDP